MFILRLLVKILLLPILLILEIFRLVMKAGIKIYTTVLGVMMLLIFGCLIYVVINQIWTSAFILAVGGLMIIAFAFLAGLAEAMLSNTCERLKSCM